MQFFMILLLRDERSMMMFFGAYFHGIMLSRYSSVQGNLLKSTVIWTVRRQGV